MCGLASYFIPVTRKERFEKITRYFQKAMPVAETELVYSNPYELLVAVILSAQCTDKRVNLVMPSFLRLFPVPEVLSVAPVEEIYSVIRSISYPNNKAKNLKGMAQKLLQDFGGVVPSEVEELMRLPGVGRKTANVIASVVYDKPALAVDTHVFRVARRIGLTHNAKTPLAAEKQLVKYFPEFLIPVAHHWLILHGRYVCKARKPECERCGVSEWCHFFKTKQKIPTPKKKAAPKRK